MAALAWLWLPLLGGRLLAPGGAFNLDAENPAVYSGAEGSYFGFAVDFFTPDRASTFLLVGAPKANTSQPGIVQGGHVLKCNWNSNRRNCQPIIFDATDQHLERNELGGLVDETCKGNGEGRLPLEDIL